MEKFVKLSCILENLGKTGKTSLHFVETWKKSTKPGQKIFSKKDAIFCILFSPLFLHTKFSSLKKVLMSQPNVSAEKKQSLEE